MRKASTRLPEQGTQTPSPAPDLIPAEPKNQPRTHIAIGTANGGTSAPFAFSIAAMPSVAKGIPPHAYRVIKGFSEKKIPEEVEH